MLPWQLKIMLLTTLESDDRACIDTWKNKYSTRSGIVNPKENISYDDKLQVLMHNMQRDTLQGVTHPLDILPLC